VYGFHQLFFRIILETEFGVVVEVLVHRKLFDQQVVLGYKAYDPSMSGSSPWISMPLISTCPSGGLADSV
jgi:hypothetical protein